MSELGELLARNHFRHRCSICKATEDERNALISELSRLREGSRWIPVEERLPDEEDDGEIVLVFRPDYGSAQQKYFQNGQFVHENGRAATDVTHWRPLPKPPEVK